MNSKFNLATEVNMLKEKSFLQALLTNNADDPVKAKARNVSTPKAVNPQRAQWVERNKNVMVNDIEDFSIQFFKPNDSNCRLDAKDVFLKPEWNWCVLRIFGGRFPGMKAINDLVNSWGVPQSHS